MKKRLIYGCLLCCVCWLAGCWGDKPVAIGFYHWKGAYAPSAASLRTADSLQTQWLYVRVLDIDWDGRQPMARAPLVMRDSFPKHWQIVPTIFITNQTMRQLSAAGADSLAKHISLFLRERHFQPARHALQIDCDWTAQSRERFFFFLEKLKGYFPTKELSATIRLHQVKYFGQTGVPPVARGMLMCYNMGEVGDSATENSILDVPLTQRYVRTLYRYPMPLDVALPIFSWAVQLRYGKPIGLIDGVSQADIAAESTAFEKLSANRYRVLRSLYLRGQYIYAGDELRIESPAAADLQAVSDLLARQLPQRDTQFRLVFYHLSDQTLQQYPYALLQDLGDRFR